MTWRAVALIAACTGCQGRTDAAAHDDAGDASDEHVLSSDGDAPDGPVGDAASLADGWDDDAHAECHRDANAMIAAGGACCLSDDDCQGAALVPPRVSCCFGHLCLYCGPK